MPSKRGFEKYKPRGLFFGILQYYMDRQVTTPNWVTSPNWDPPPPCKQAFKLSLKGFRITLKKLQKRQIYVDNFSSQQKLSKVIPMDKTSAVCAELMTSF